MALLNFIVSSILFYPYMTSTRHINHLFMMEKYARIDYIPYFRFLEIPRSSINAIEAQDKRTRGMLFFLLNPQLFGNL